MIKNKGKEKKNQDKSFSNIGVRSFITVVIILVSVILISGALSYFIPQGEFSRNEDGEDSFSIVLDDDIINPVFETYYKLLDDANEGDEE